MLKNVFLLSIALTTIASCSKASEGETKQPVKATEITANLKYNEGTVVYNNTLLVSNFGSSVLDPLNQEGKGYISQITGSRNEIFLSDSRLSAPKGMAIAGNHLLVSDVGKVLVYNLQDKAQAPQVVDFPEGNLFVNDIAIAGHTAYISVTNTGKLFKLDISDVNAITPAKLSEYASVVGANGLLIDGTKMYIASYPADGVTTADNVIYLIDNLANPKPTKFITRQGQYDGLALRGQTLYFSNWENGEIGTVDLMTKEITSFTIEGATISGPADISIMQNVLYIPTLPLSKVVVVPLP